MILLAKNLADYKLIGKSENQDLLGCQRLNRSLAGTFRDVTSFSDAR